MNTAKRRIVTGTAALGLIAGGLFGLAPTAFAEPECLHASSDFDEDETADVVVGIPGATGHGGAVEVRLSNQGHPFTTRLTGVNGFGTAVTSLSSYTNEGDDALCSQLVVGSPNEDRGSGAVRVYTWNAATRQFVARGVFSPQRHGVGGLPQDGAHFGAALAALPRESDRTDPEPARLWVGSPGFDVLLDDGVRRVDAGRLTSFWIDPGENPQAHDTRIINYSDESDLPDALGGEKLGSSLSVAHFMLAAGAPGRIVAGASGAGAVVIAAGDDSLNSFVATEITQATPGVPGRPENGDHYGAAVSLLWNGADGLVAIGAPGEDIGRLTNAGSVTIALLSLETGKVTGAHSVDQDSAGVAGRAESGDEFGSALACEYPEEPGIFWIGSPGEDVGRARDAGMVASMETGRGWNQNSRGVPGTAETGDRMGASLGGSPGCHTHSPVIGVPGEDSATGAVLIGVPHDDLQVVRLRGTTPGDRYGFAVNP